MATEQQIDPYNVSGGVDEQGNAKAIDYDRLIEEFGTQRLTQEHITRFEKVTGRKAPKLMRRGLFFSHRDFDKALDYYEKYGTFMLYTGRGPSSGSVHLGHTIPFLMTKELQEIFDVPLVIMLTDDEKYLHTMDKNNGVRKEGNTLGDFMDYADDNIRDIIALGFDVNKTFIFSDLDFMGGHFWQNTLEFSALISNNQVRGAFGFTGETSIGKNFYGAEQCIAAFPSSFPEIFGLPDNVRKRRRGEGRRPHASLSKIPCLIPCAIDQEPYFRILRANSERMTDPHPKTSLILSKFLSGLGGPTSKMSASDPNSAIFMSDTPNQIKKKINSSFSGGRETVEEQRKYGGNPDVDVAYAYLSYFLEDDAELATLEQQYRSGELLTGELKKRCIEELQKFVADFQKRRAEVTDEVVESFMADRKLVYGGNPNPTHPNEDPAALKDGAAPTSSNVAGTKLADGNVISSGKSAEKKAAKLAKIAEQKAAKEKERLAKEAEKLSLVDK